MFIVFGLYCNYPSNVNGSPFPCDLYFFGTDKDIYYNDEIIEINATYELDYAPSETSYIRIRILNISDHLLWETIEYHQEGNFSRTWYVDIKSLDLAYENNSNTLYVKFYWYSDMMGSLFLGELEAIAIKRNVSCELIEYSDFIKYGDDLNIRARFYNTSISSEYFVSDQQILFEIVLQNSTAVFSKFYITNSTGEFKSFIPNVRNLSIGVNHLRFTIVDNHFFNSDIFKYEFYFQTKPVVENLTSEEDEKENKESSGIDQTIIISLSLVASALIGIVLFLHFNNMKKKPIDMHEITFRY
jgi:hypothetical protein